MRNKNIGDCTNGTNRSQRIQAHESQQDFVEAAHKVEGDGAWIQLDPTSGAGIKQLIQDKLPKKSLEELVLMKDFRINIASKGLRQAGEQTAV